MSEKKELVEAFQELLNAAIEYVEYKHDGDPWSEDARAMGEMELNDMHRAGRFVDYVKLIESNRSENYDDDN